jgi:hypothetical protein
MEKRRGEWGGGTWNILKSKMKAVDDPVDEHRTFQ